MTKHEQQAEALHLANTECLILRLRLKGARAMDCLAPKKLALVHNAWSRKSKCRIVLSMAEAEERDLRIKLATGWHEEIIECLSGALFRSLNP